MHESKIESNIQEAKRVVQITAVGFGYNGNNDETLRKIKEELEGKILCTKKSGELVVKKYINHREVHVEFLKTGYKAIVPAYSVRNGGVNDPLLPRVAGVGFMGEGEYSSTIKRSGSACLAYTTWRGMLRRCYDINSVNYALYKGVTVHESWHNFQNFAAWFYSQKYAGKGFALDKDLLVFGSKEYSPQTCSMVPVAVNSLFTGFVGRVRDRGVPTGVRFRPKSNVYTAEIQLGEVTKNGNKKQTIFGPYKTLSDALLAYKDAKEKYVKIIAEKYREVLHPQVYNNLINYTMDISDWVENKYEVNPQPCTFD